MTESLPIIEARSKLSSLPERLEQDPSIGAIAITRRGKPVMALMSWELYESIAETLEVMGDEELMSALRKSVQEVDASRTVSWKTVKEKLDL